MDTGTGAGAFGSPLAAPLFLNSVIAAMKAYDGLYDAATWVPTKTGAKFSLPTVDDTAVSAVKITQGVQSTEADPNSQISAAQLDESGFWRSGFVKVSFELLQDSGIDLEAFFAKIFAIRYARGLGKSLVNAVKANAAVGLTTGTAASIFQDEIFQLAGSLDAAYAMAPGCGWLMAWSTLVNIWQLKSGSGQYQFVPSWDANRRPLLIGKPVFISPTMDAIAASAKTIAFGDLSRVYVRHVNNSLELKRYDERFADYGQVGFEGFWRIDGTYVPAGTGSDSPIVLLQQHA
jgi:HK97 family phage major capsid protein